MLISGFTAGYGLGSSVSFNHTASSKEWHRLIQLNCAETDWVAHVDSVAVNPDQQYLSLAEVPYITVYR